MDEVFENDVLGDVELDNVFDEVVNDLANNVIVIESHSFENVLIHGRAKCSIPLEV